MKVESIQKKLFWALLSTITLIHFSGCLPGIAGPELPEEPVPSPTPLMAEVLMRVQLDYLELARLDFSELQKDFQQKLASAQTRLVPELQRHREDVMYGQQASEAPNSNSVSF